MQCGWSCTHVVESIRARSLARPPRDFWIDTQRSRKQDLRGGPRHQGSARFGLLALNPGRNETLGCPARLDPRQQSGDDVMIGSERHGCAVRTDCVGAGTSSAMAYARHDEKTVEVCDVAADPLLHGRVVAP